jgi:hypothetical protein
MTEKENEQLKQELDAGKNSYNLLLLDRNEYQNKYNNECAKNEAIKENCKYCDYVYDCRSKNSQKTKCDLFIFGLFKER